MHLEYELSLVQKIASGSDMIQTQKEHAERIPYSQDIPVAYLF